MACIQPRLLLRGAFDFSALARRDFTRRCQPQLRVVLIRRFHETVALDAIRFPKLRKQKRWLKCQPRSYVRLEAYSFLGLSEGA